MLCANGSAEGFAENGSVEALAAIVPTGFSLKAEGAAVSFTGGFSSDLLSSVVSSRPSNDDTATRLSSEGDVADVNSAFSLLSSWGSSCCVSGRSLGGSVRETATVFLGGS